MMTVQSMYDLTHTRARTLLESVTYPWEHTIILRKMFGLLKALR